VDTRATAADRTDAAPSSSGIEDHRVLPVACPLRGGAQQVQVELAHDLAVLPGESMERAVAEHEPAAGVGAGFEPLVLQDPLKRPAASGQRPTGLLSGALQRLRHRLAGARRLLDRGQQQIAGEVVPAFRDGDRDLAGCLGVELRRPPGPRPGPPGETSSRLTGASLRDT
jgi:hypothetical protein